jgi:hypothetical protein
VTPELLDVVLEDGGRRAHPWATPFRKSATYLEELQMAVLLFPLDPAMPGLAELTGSEGTRLLEDRLPECRGGARIEAMTCELAHYKPLDRAVLKIRIALRGPLASESRRTVYAKFFADAHGAECSSKLEALWSATRGATWLRVPEPLGYDPGRGMMLMRAAEGEPDLTGWIQCIEQGEPLPEGLGAERLDRCALASARALRELQRSGVGSGTKRTFQHELARMKRDGELLLGDVRASRPALAASAAALLARLERLAPATERLVPAHGAFRHKQMLGNDLALTVIDWDGLCLANPALDAAAFLGRLSREPLRRPGAAPELARMASLFRGAFLEDQPEVAPDLDLYQGMELTEQVLRSFRHPDEESAAEIQSLAEAAAAMLDRVDAARKPVPRTFVLSKWLARTAASLALHLMDSVARIGNGGSH